MHSFIRLLPAFAATLCTTVHLVAADRPNVLLILADDLGSVDLNCYGSDDLETPSLDALARSGVKFNQFYAAAPVCSPSRAGLLTGRYPQRAGVPGNVSSKAGNPGMPASQITIAEELKANGYATAHIGKWHLGYTPETMPNGQGFDYSFGHMGGCIDNYSHFFYWNGPNRHDLHRNGEEVFHDGQYFPDLMVDELNAYVDRTKDKPWFIYWAINVPHYPYQGDKKWLKYYEDLPYPRNLYAAFVSAMDERIGRVLDHLKSNRLEDNTIVIFQSDHGHSEEERAHFGGGNSGPFRGQKFSLFEGGIRVPAIISRPGSIPEGETRDQFATGSDWYPTILQLTNSRAGKHRLDGRSLFPIIWAETAPSEHKVFHWESGGGQNNRQWAVRDGDWKLVMNGRNSKPDEKIFLSNLAESVSETKNQAKENSEIVARLTKLHHEWLNDLEP